MGCAVESEPSESLPPDWSGEACDQRRAICHGDDPEWPGACVPLPTDHWSYECWPACDPVGHSPECPRYTTPFIYGGQPGRAGFCACVDLNVAPAQPPSCLACDEGRVCDPAVGWRCWGGAREPCAPLPDDPTCGPGAS